MLSLEWRALWPVRVVITVLGAGHAEAWSPSILNQPVDLPHSLPLPEQGPLDPLGSKNGEEGGTPVVSSSSTGKAPHPRIPRGLKHRNWFTSSWFGRGSAVRW